MDSPLRTCQREAIELLSNGRHNGLLLDWEMGIGKSRVIVEIIKRHMPQRVLVASPKPVMSVWPDQLEQWWPDHAKYVNVTKLDGTVKQATDRLKSIREPVIVIVNYDRVWRQSLARAILSRSWDLVVADEVHRIKSPGSKVSMFFRSLSKHATLRIGLSGTPMPHSPLDIYAIARFIDPTIYQSTAAAFRSTYAVYGGPIINGRARQVVDYKNMHDFADRYAQLANVVKRKDVLTDLPPVAAQRVRVDMSADAERTYRSLSDDLMAQVSEGVITAANAMVAVMRLQQISSGYGAIENDDGTTRPVQIDTAKRQAMKELIEDMPRREPVVVFARFRWDLDVIASVAEELGRPMYELSGRADHVRGVWRPEQPGGVLAVQAQAGGVGIDLTAACYVIYYSHTTNCGDYLQSLARVDRPGQTRPVMIYHLLASGTVDEKIIAAHERRAAMSDDIRTARDVAAEVLGIGD